MRTTRLLTTGTLLIMALAGSAGTSDANAIFTVTLDTTSLSGLPGPFAVMFQLNDGAGIGDGNNTATIGDFAFGGGSAVPGTTLTGGASGNMSAGVSLTDTSFFNSFAQAFIPGTSLFFQVNLTTNVDGGGTPDAFAFSVLDNGFPIATQDIVGSDTFLSVDLDSASPVINTYGTPPGAAPMLSAPRIGEPLPPPSNVPEPASVVLLATGAALVGIARRLSSTR